MILSQNDSGVEKLGNFEEKEFVLKGTRKAFRTLIGNLYSDKIAAVIREISQNAHDSHVAAGKSDIPFDVTLPSVEKPTFIVRDYGMGMSHSFITNEYLVGFSSSKDTSNDYDGALGIGRLSLLSLCDAYFLTSIQNGKKRSYSVYFNDSGIPVLSFLGEKETDEQNGVIIEAPIDPLTVYSFDNKAKEIYRYYSVKPNILNCLEFQIPANEYLITGDGWALAGNDYPSVAIMSVYGYPINSDSLPELTLEQTSLLECGIAINFKLGELEPQANREGLYYSKTTIENIKKRLDLIWLDLQTILTKQFEGKSV